ncbi:MAG: inosine/xanthosine triphosphatase [Parcubacteria group bacterium]|nr:inosine/xanthosine triphosphatase [Parcubacteria group bacterium]
MKICVGSKNDVKISAVKEVLAYYDDLRDAEICSHEVDSAVSAQPKSIDETMQGAMNRARGAFRDCAYSFGIESGLMVVPNTKTGYMDVCVCAIYDGKQFSFGLSSALEFPREVTRLIFEEGVDSTQAFNKIGLTTNPQIGSAEGIIGVLTKGRLTRKDYTKQAVLTAMIHLEHPELY